MSPYPTAWAEIQFPGQIEKTILKIFETEKERCSHNETLGNLVIDGKKFAKIALKDGFIHLRSVQVAGKKRMDIGELLRGMQI